MSKKIDIETLDIFIEEIKDYFHESENTTISLDNLYAYRERLEEQREPNFELIPNHIKSLDELKDLDKAVYKGNDVYKNDRGFWYDVDMEEPLGVTSDTVNIENWEYFEEEG